MYVDKHRVVEYVYNITLTSEEANQLLSTDPNSTIAKLQRYLRVSVSSNVR